MSVREKLIDDIARFAGEAVGFVSDAKRQANQSLRSRLDEFALKMDLVPREDYERLEAIVIKTREEQKVLMERIELLESHLFGDKKAPKGAKTKTGVRKHQKNK